MILFTLGNSSDAFLLFRVQEAIHKSGAVVDIVGRIRPLHEMVSGFGDKRTQSDIINILFLPLIWAFFHIIKVVCATPMGTLSDRIGRKIVINTGWAIYAFVYLAFALLVFLSPGLQVLATFVLFGIYALFYAFTEGTGKAFVADLVSDENRGTAFGLMTACQNVGLLAFPYINGALRDATHSYTGTQIMFAGLGVVGLIFAFLLLTAKPGWTAESFEVRSPGMTTARPSALCCITPSRTCRWRGGSSAKGNTPRATRPTRTAR